MRKPWQAQISVNDVFEYLGSFDTEEEAARAFDRRAREGGGRHRLNFPDDDGAADAADDVSGEDSEASDSDESDDEIGGGGGLGDGDGAALGAGDRCFAIFDGAAQPIWGGTIVRAGRAGGDLRVVWDDGQTTTTPRAEVYARLKSRVLRTLKVVGPNARARATVAALLP